MKQIDIFEWLQDQKKQHEAQTPPKNTVRLVKNELSTVEHEILNIIKERPLATEEIMDRYSLERVDVRTMIRRIRRYKPSHVMIMNVRVEYKGAMRYGYSSEGVDLLYKRWESATETALKNNPFLINAMYKTLNILEQKTQDLRVANGQSVVQFNGWEHETVNFHKGKEDIK